jgi:hypothetical protein
MGKSWHQARHQTETVLNSHLQDALHSRISPRSINVPDVYLKLGLTRDAIHGVGAELYKTSGAHGVDGTRIQRCLLHCQRQLSGCQASIVPAAALADSLS